MIYREEIMTRYAYRLETRRIKDPDFPYTGERFTYPEAVAEFCRSLQGSDVERMIVLHLTTKNSLIGIQFFSGTVDRAIVHPREIIKHSLLTGGAAIILVHNHPQGIPTLPPKTEQLPRPLFAAPSSLT